MADFHRTEVARQRRLRLVRASGASPEHLAPDTSNNLAQDSYIELISVKDAQRSIELYFEHLPTDVLIIAPIDKTDRISFTPALVPGAGRRPFIRGREWKLVAVDLGLRVRAAGAAAEQELLDDRRTRR